MFKKAFLSVGLLSSMVTTAVVAGQEEQQLLIVNPNGVLTFTHPQGTIYGAEFFVNGRAIGAYGYLPPKVEEIGSNGRDDFYLLSAGTGGSGCSEVLSVIKVNEDGYQFSDLMNACGGYIEYKLIGGDNSIEIRALERDESSVNYIVGQDTLKISSPQYPDFSGGEFFEK